MNWDSWRGSMDGRPTLWERRLWSLAGRVIDIHKMVAKDDPDCFHTHPSYAIRIIVWGGYVEEVEGGAHRMWRPGMIGIVSPALSHRVAGLRNGRASYSIWIRLRKRTKVELRGGGWHQQEQIFRAPGTIFEADQGTVAVASTVTEIVRELRDDYPAVDVTTVVFSPDFSNVGCCVIPQDRVLAIIAALSTLSSAEGKSPCR